jgi:hypothetical protein
LPENNNKIHCKLVITFRAVQGNLNVIRSKTGMSIRRAFRAALNTNQVSSGQGEGFCNIVQFRADVGLP